MIRSQKTKLLSFWVCFFLMQKMLATCLLQATTSMQKLYRLDWKKVASILLEFVAVLFFGTNDVAISTKGTWEICQIQQLDAICSGRSTIYRLNWFHAFILDGFKHHNTSKLEPTTVLWMNTQTVYVAFRPPGILWNIFSLIIVGCTWDMSCYA